MLSNLASSLRFVVRQSIWKGMRHLAGKLCLYFAFICSKHIWPREHILDDLCYCWFFVFFKHTYYSLPFPPPPIHKGRHNETGDVGLNAVSASCQLRVFAGVSELVSSSITGIETNPQLHVLSCVRTPITVLGTWETLSDLILKLNINITHGR